jgi:acetyl-CoA C-acetyltransferase
MNVKLDPNTPILVGVGVTQQKFENPLDALNAHQLMTKAVKAAAVDTGNQSILTQAEIISVPKGTWKYSNPAQLIADDIGAKNAETILAKLGILQQSLIGDACERIAGGEISVAIVAGGEAKYRQLRATITETELNDQGYDQDHESSQSEPDVTLTPADELWSPIESKAGLAMPVGYYAILESALCHGRGQNIEQHRDQLAELYQGFSQVAVENPDAWNRTLTPASLIRDVNEKNKMLAFPYTKNHNSQWNVDQAAGLIFCSVAKARAMAIDEKKWIFPLASTESNHMVNVSQRRQLHRCPGARIAGNRALAIAGVDIDKLDYLDMYSCFPAAVQIYALELGISLQRKPLTVTGGMTFGGGPLNNYVLQATCKMAQILRSDPGAKGMVTSVSGMLTKQGFGLWSTESGGQRFANVDVSDEVMAVDNGVELVDAHQGGAVILGYTVLFAASDPARAIAVCELPDGKRTVVFSADSIIMEKMMTEDLCGRSVQLVDGEFQLQGADTLCKRGRSKEGVKECKPN